MTTGGLVTFGFLMVVLVITLFLLGVAIINWNVNDIIEHGVNFWNVFWLSLVAVTWFGTTGGVGGTSK